MSMTPVAAQPAIRRATAADAALIARWGKALDVEAGGGTAPWSAARVRRDGFGADPAFEVLIAELSGRSVGMALFFDAWDSDLCVRALFLSDLYVAPASRSTGVGVALMRALARAAARRGAGSVFWPVHRVNAGAAAFYAHLGAAPTELRLMELDGDALARLAEEG